MTTIRRFFTISVITLSIYAFCGEPELLVHFINVGQGNATLLRFPCGTMLIDAGAEDSKYAERLMKYLDDNLEEKNGKKVIDVLLITHTHKDHNLVLEQILKKYDVKCYVDNGMVMGSGEAGARSVRHMIERGEINTKLVTVNEECILDSNIMNGFSNDSIDPFKCADCDPRIRILSASRDERPQGWSKDAFRNQNNHSLVVRVDFGESSFLFPGDLENAGVKSILKYYNDSPSILDVDLWQVSHHGAENGTTKELLECLSLSMAVISCGDKEYGAATSSPWDAYTYGHPRAKVVKLLESAINKDRPLPVTGWVATGQFRFEERAIEKSIYSTSWDGTIIVKGYKDRDPEMFQMIKEELPEVDE